MELKLKCLLLSSLQNLFNKIENNERKNQMYKMKEPKV